MDLRSIINNSDSSNAAPAPPTPKSASPPKQIPQYQQPSQQSPLDVPSAAYPDSRRDTRPPHPPPLQPPPHGDVRSPNGSLSHGSAQSPYQHTPTSSFGGGQYPFPQHSPAQGHPPPQREGSTLQSISGQSISGTHTYAQPSPSSYTPTATTPGSAHAYASYPRPHSSHSSTPTSAQSHVQHFPRESPRIKHSQMSAPPQAYPTQPQHHQSQPGTPLRPPPSIGKPSSSLSREASGSNPYSHQRTQSGGSFSNPQMPLVSPSSETPLPLATSPSAYGPRPMSSSRSSYPAQQDRERSLSVSPKTRLPSQTRTEMAEAASGQNPMWPGNSNPAKRKIEDTEPTSNYTLGPNQFYYQGRPVFNSMEDSLSTLNAVDSERTLINMSLAQKQMHSDTNSSSGKFSTGPSQFQREIDGPSPPGMMNSGSPPVMSSRQPPSTPRTLSSHKSPSQSTTTPPSDHRNTSGSGPSVPPGSAFPQPGTGPGSIPQLGSNNAAQQPARKRARHEEPPIFVYKSDHRKGGTPLPPKKRPPPSRSIPSQPVLKHEPMETKPQVHQLNTTPPAKSEPVRSESNGNLASGPTFANTNSLPKPQPPPADQGPSGLWEPSILNIIPSEEVTRVIMDFLFVEVVNREDVGFGPAGGAPGMGAVIEIEAKIGQLIDKNTNDRLRLPVMTECVVSNADPSLRINFKSSMTESQHRSLNGFLNKALVDSKGLPSSIPPIPKPRVAMNYVHTRECDAFYELSQAGLFNLPHAIRNQLNPRHNKPKVRISTDQKTGQVLAKIIKARVADIDIYSPRTAFDWRISVNLEMNYDGDMRDLVEASEAGQRKADRNKDRVSYRHQAYQIDLTQVTPSEATSKADKEHELEIEVSSADIRRQGLLAKAGQPSNYEELVRGFIDNVRVLARHCQ
ncbi:mRNA-capping enzyme subunit beta [Loxospora ochrophaea]|nr:mRNA-capping enzyme subunit beta [Loxospora ochrophaea]